MHQNTQTANYASDGWPVSTLPPPRCSELRLGGGLGAGKTYYENPFKSGANLLSPIEPEEILRQQKGFIDLHLSGLSPSSSDRARIESGLGRDKLKTQIGLIPEDFVRTAADPGGIDRLRVLALVAMDAYQPAGYKYVPENRAEMASYGNAREAWEKLCDKTALNDINCRRRATENLVGTYNGILKICRQIDEAKGWHYFDSAPTHRSTRGAPECGPWSGWLVRR